MSSARAAGVLLIGILLTGCGDAATTGGPPPATRAAPPTSTTAAPTTTTTTAATTTSTTEAPTTTTTSTQPATTTSTTAAPTTTTSTQPATTTTTVAVTSTSAASVVTVEISGFAFHAADVTIPVGTKVKWVNRDSVSHTTTADGGGWARTLGADETYRRTFDTPGVFTYHCAIHPSMTGTITVTG